MSTIVAADEKEVVEYVRSVKAHGHGKVTVDIQDHKIMMIDENRKYKPKN